MITVTGATGHLGRHVIEGLLARVPASQIVAVVRDPGKAAEIAARGVNVRRGDYDQPASLGDALAGAEKLLFISGNADGAQRIPQHAALVAAAKRAGVKLVAYTSITFGERSPMKLAGSHIATEKLIRDAGLPFVFLRDNWYFENYTARMGQILEHGLIGSAGDGRIAGAARADFAAAAVAVLTGEGHAGQVYELGGDTPFTMRELAAEIARQSGKPVTYTDLPPEAYRAALVSFGLPEPYADALADSDVAIKGGALDERSGTLRRLIGRPTTTLAEAVAAALKG
jgi:NAD(P)H dehydrogenase (quinone)